ncbi:MAG: ATP-grasp domain-containing protein, partial [Cyanobacteria bacterium J06635_11]
SRVSAPFYSVDIATTVEGTLQVVELGDGQVSDKKNWPLDRFVDMLIENASASASSKV